MAKAIIHFLDSSRGQFIPRDFCRQINKEFLQCVDFVLVEELSQENSNDYEFYWENWDHIIKNARIQFEGNTYTLHQDGDLWLINYDKMTAEERQNFGFDD